MSDVVTIARPYAKAVFDFAVEYQTLESWRSMLAFAAEVSSNEQMIKLLTSSIPFEEIANIFIAVCDGQLDFFSRNLIRIMAKNKRLALLPNVLETFVNLCETQESIVEIEIVSAHVLNNEQLVEIISTLENRLSRKIKLRCNINKFVVGGIVIRTNNMVIDGSIRGRLERLADVLQF